MQVRETSLRGLIGGQRQFRVPIFQRQYTWGRVNHDQLWRDLLGQYEAIDPEQAEGHASGTETSTHFVGSFVLMPIAGAASAPVSSFVVVDGQQRLTTLMLLLCAIRDRAAMTDEEAIERYNDLYLVNKWDKNEDYFRLVLTPTDKQAFFGAVQGDEHRIRLSVPIREAYAYYVSHLQQPVAGQGLDLDRLTRAVVDRISIVDITTGAGDNPFRIFESINATGVRLTQGGLLRNYFFMRLPTRGEEVYRTVWQPLENAVGFENLEGLARVDLQRRGLDVAKDEVYRRQKERLDNLPDEASVEREIEDLRLRADDYSKILLRAREEDTKSRRTLEWLHAWGAQTTHPLLMKLYELRRTGVCSIEDLRESFRYIESFVVRRYFAGVATNTMNRLFVQMLSEVGGPDVANSVRTALSRERRYWPTNAELRDAMRQRNFYFTGRSNQRLLTLQRLEESYEHREPIDFAAAKLSIEHVMPQTLSREWRDHLSQLGQDPDEVHELRHTIGNLTLTAFNGELSNNPFERKQQIYGDSGLRLNRLLAERPSWGRDDILARAKDLWAQAIKIWPGPIKPAPITDADADIDRGMSSG